MGVQVWYDMIDRITVRQERWANGFGWGIEHWGIWNELAKRGTNVPASVAGRGLCATEAKAAQGPVNGLQR